MIKSYFILFYHPQRLFGIFDVFHLVLGNIGKRYFASWVTCDKKYPFFTSVFLFIDVAGHVLYFAAFDKECKFPTAYRCLSDKTREGGSSAEQYLQQNKKKNAPH